MSAALRVLVAFVALALGHGAPAAVNSDDVARFLDDQPRFYGPRSASDEVLEILVAQLPKSGFDGAADALAKKWRLPRAAAALAAEAELKAHLARSTPSGDPTAYVPIYLAALDLAPTSTPLRDAFLERLDADGTCNYAGAAERYFALPDSVEPFLRSRNECSSWMTKLPAAYVDAPLALYRLANSLEYYDPLGRAAASARLLELLRRADAPGGEAELVSALRWHWDHLVEAGLASSLLREAADLDQDVVARALDPGYAPRARIDQVDIGYERTTVLRDQFVVALLSADRRQDAAAWFGTPKENTRSSRPEDPRQRAGQGPYVFGDPARDRTELIRNLLAPPAVDPFDLFIGDGVSGLVWTAGTGTPVVERATADFFAAQGYAEISKKMRANLCEARADALGREAEGGLPPRVQELRAQYVAEFKQEWFASGLCTQQPVAQSEVARAALDYIERPMPENLRTVRPKESADDEEAAQPTCIENVVVVRCDTSGERWAAISISADVDPTGEIGAGGYWLHLSHDRGATWDRPIYLGLQQFQPYVLPGTSRLPMLSGSMLQLEVQVRELDPASISFPPVGLRSKREADDLYIERSLDDLARDSDHDGLTDLLEDKLRSNPLSVDTDSDGLDDASDPLPGISLKAAPPADADVIARIFEHILGYDAGAIRLGVASDENNDLFALLKHGPDGRSARVTFLRADKSLFGGLLLPAPVVVLDPQDLDYLNARYGIHLPVHFPAPWFNKSRTQAVVHWSAGWTGGTLLFTKQAGGGWKMEEVERWIT
jgi:hypothetical protein